jgi:hypothetical protein
MGREQKCSRLFFMSLGKIKKWKGGTNMLILNLQQFAEDEDENTENQPEETTKPKRQQRKQSTKEERPAWVDEILEILKPQQTQQQVQQVPVPKPKPAEEKEEENQKTSQPQQKATSFLDWLL